MLFWKKSEDPWDQPVRRPKPRPAPEAGAGTGQEENTAQELREMFRELGKGAREFFGMEEKAPEPEVPPQMCPWCGKAADALVINTEGGTLAGYRTAWRCGACEKMVLDVADIQPEAFLGIPARAPEEDTQAPESNIDHE